MTKTNESSTERHDIVLTAVGPDRPGIVSEIAAIIHAAGCNLEDSRMAILAGEFALILLFSGRRESVQRVRQRCEARIEQELGFSVTFKEAGRVVSRQHYLAQRLTVTGNDQAGIVRRVSEAVASRGINVASLESRVTPAAFSGTPLFTLHAELQIPDPAALGDLRGTLDHVCDELNLTYVLEPL